MAGAFGGAPAYLPPPLSIAEMIGRPGKAVPLAKKGAPWTDEEHSAFLAGLKVYGRGQWKQISRYYVPSRTPTQVASHAQKHFLRQSGAQKRRSRFSAVEEAAAAPQPPVPQLLPPLPLSGLHRPPGMVAAAPPATAPGVPAMPTLFGHSLPPAQHAAAFLPPQPRLVGAPGTVVGGVAMGVPIGVLPPLPSITTASGAELPILPVLPGRINAIAASAAASAPAAPTPPPAATASYSGSGDSGSERRHSSPSPGPEERKAQRSRVSAAALPPSGSSAKPSYAPSGRTQQLLRLLELNEQLAASSAGAAGAEGGTASTSSAQGRRAAAAGGGAAAAAAATAMDWQSSVKRVPSATAALDTLALLAEAEAESDAGNAEPAHSARTHLVSAF